MNFVFGFPTVLKGKFSLTTSFPYCLYVVHCFHNVKIKILYEISKYFIVYFSTPFEMDLKEETGTNQSAMSYGCGLTLCLSRRKETLLHLGAIKKPRYMRGVLSTILNFIICNGYCGVPLMGAFGFTIVITQRFHH
jgi:hypothetical protein